MRLKVIGVLLTFYLFLPVTYSQDTSQNTKIKYSKLALGVSPSSFFNSVQGLQFSIDAGITDYLNFSSEIAYLFNSGRSNIVNGYRLRPSIEFMVYSNTNTSLQFGIFSLFRNFYEHRKYSIFHTHYTQYYPVIRQKNLKGAGIAIATVGKIDENIKLEFGIGMGSGKLIISDDKESEGRIENQSFWGYDFVGETTMPILYFNINISYTLIK